MIYNRKFLFISMIIVLLISTLIYLCSTQKKSDKDNLYETKYRKLKIQKRKAMVSHPIIQLQLKLEKKL